MSEETNEPIPDRYALEISGGAALILDLAADVPAVVESYRASDPIALDRLAVLNRRAAAGVDNPLRDPLTPTLADGDVPTWDSPLSAPVTPREFLGVTLPTKAREQRLEGLCALLAEARGVETEAVKQIREFSGLLNDAIQVRQRVEDRIAALRGQVLDSHAVSALSRPQPY